MCVARLPLNQTPKLPSPQLQGGIPAHLNSTHSASLRPSSLRVSVLKSKSAKEEGLCHTSHQEPFQSPSHLSARVRAMPIWKQAEESFKKDGNDPPSQF